MYDNVRFTVATALERERKKVNKSDGISSVRTDFKKHDEGSSFKEKYEEAKREHTPENKDGIVIDSSLSKRIQENKVMERLVEERFAHNPLLNDILKDKISKTMREE